MLILFVPMGLYEAGRAIPVTSMTTNRTRHDLRLMPFVPDAGSSKKEHLAAFRSKAWVTFTTWIETGAFQYLGSNLHIPQDLLRPSLLRDTGLHNAFAYIWQFRVIERSSDTIRRSLALLIAVISACCIPVCISPVRPMI